MRKGTKSGWVSELAMRWIKRLFELAEEIYVKNPKRSIRYIELAKKISSKYNIPLSSVIPGWKKRVCKSCGVFWFPGKNVRVRTNSKTKAVEYRCLNCGFVKRFGYAKTG